MVFCLKEDDFFIGFFFKNFSGVFIFIGVGFVMGFLMFGIECIVFKWKKRKVKFYWVKLNVFILKYMYQEQDYMILSLFFF